MPDLRSGIQSFTVIGVLLWMRITSSFVGSSGPGGFLVAWEVADVPYVLLDVSGDPRSPRSLGTPVAAHPAKSRSRASSNYWQLLVHALWSVQMATASHWE